MQTPLGDASIVRCDPLNFCSWSCRAEAEDVANGDFFVFFSVRGKRGEEEPGLELVHTNSTRMCVSELLTFNSFSIDLQFFDFSLKSFNKYGTIIALCDFDIVTSRQQHWESSCEPDLTESHLKWATCSGPQRRWSRRWSRRALREQQRLQLNTVGCVLLLEKKKDSGSLD